MSDLPKGWTATTVGEAGTVQLGRQRSPENHDGPRMRPYLRVANVYEGRIDASDVMTMNFSDEEFARFKLEAGDILLNEGQTKELVGRPAIYGGEVPGACFTNSLVRFKPRAGVEPRYAYNVFRHYMRSGEFQRIAQITTNIAHLGAGRFAGVPFSLPPLPEQRRIVAKLDALLARSRKAKEALDRLPALLDKLRQSVLAAAFRGDLTKEWRAAHPDVEPARKLLERIRAERRRRWEEGGRAKGKDPRKVAYGEPGRVESEGLAELPEGWAWASLADLVMEGPTNGLSPVCDPAGAGPLVLKLTATTSGELVLGDHAVKRAVALIERGADCWIRRGDILVQRANSLEYLGATAVFDGPEDTYVFPDLMMRLRVSDATLRTYLWRALNGPDVRRHFQSRATGTAGNMPKINGSILRETMIPVPGTPEMEEIVRRIQPTLASVAKLEAVANGLASRLLKQEQALLAKAFRGELVPQDPNDEPASVLLERIQAERTVAGDAGPKRGRKPARG